MNPGNVATVSAYASWNNGSFTKDVKELNTIKTVKIFPYSVGSTILDSSERNGVVSKLPKVVKALA